MENIINLISKSLTAAAICCASFAAQAQTTDSTAMRTLDVSRMSITIDQTAGLHNAGDLMVQSSDSKLTSLGFVLAFGIASYAMSKSDSPTTKDAAPWVAGVGLGVGLIIDINSIFQQRKAGRILRNL